jgi:hypothetical protein
MKEAKKETGRKFVQVSLAQDFAADLRAQADAADRSMAAQLEHWAKIARAVEAVIPAPGVSELKAGKDASEVLSRLGAYLVQQDPARLVARLEASRTARYGIDEADPDVAIRIDPDGTQTRGSFDAAGNFIAAATERTQGHDRRSDKAGAGKTAQGRAPARPRPATGRKRDPVTA